MEYQAEKLRKLLNHANKHVPYYRRVFEKCDINLSSSNPLDELKKMPFLSKKSIRNNLKDLVATNYNNRMFQYQTGGSTGEPLQIYIDQKVQKTWSFAAAIRGFEWWGYRLGEPLLHFWSSPFDASSMDTLYSKIWRLLGNEYFMDAYQMTKDTINTYIAFFLKHKDIFVRSYPSSIYRLAEEIRKRNINRITERLIFTTGETLYEEHKKVIEGVFNCKVCDYYGNRETNTIIIQCPEFSNYHVSRESVIVEIIKDGKDADENEEGEIIITDLCNYAMPFIRYQIGDIGLGSNETCGCGRGLKTIKGFQGRLNDVIALPDSGYLISACK